MNGDGILSVMGQRHAKLSSYDLEHMTNERVVGNHFREIILPQEIKSHSHLKNRNATIIIN